jgi:hypothetical protein
VGVGASCSGDASMPPPQTAEREMKTCCCKIHPGHQQFVLKVHKLTSLFYLLYIQFFACLIPN